jgi:WYL domain/Putative addiction module component
VDTAPESRGRARQYYPEARRGSRREHTNDPSRPRRSAGSWIPCLRRHDQRNKVLAGREETLGALAGSGLTFSELCALYFSRALTECFAETHLLADVQSALDKFESALTPQMKKFIDRLPRVVTAKPAGAKRQSATTYQVIARLLEAILHQRVVRMRYHSHASRREKDYVIHPYRLVHVQGGVPLVVAVVVTRVEIHSRATLLCMDAKQLLEEALCLPDGDRAALVGELIQSLDSEVDPDAEAAWSVEIRARLERG